MTSLITNIYSKSPLIIQNLLISAYGYHWQKRRFGGIFPYEYHWAKEREFFSKAEWKEYQNAEMEQLLQHAYKNVPFYKEKFTNHGLTAADLQNIDIDHLHLLPITLKDEVRKYGKTSLLSLNKDSKGNFFSSSGSTGTPVEIYYSHKMHQKWFALYEARVRNWAGVNKNMWRGMIGGRRIITSSKNIAPFYRYNFFEKQIYFSAYHIGPATITDYAKAFKKYPITYMTGYAMSNFFLAKLFNEKNISIPPLKAIITSSEKLTDEMRTTFSKVYGCKTYDSWSGMEYCGLISECEHGSLHINPDVGIIEVLNDAMQPVKENEIGTIYCTGFLNYDQPLIRYKIGDSIILSNTSCTCGRSMPIVKEIIGRTEDIVYGKDGRRMVRFHGIFVGLNAIKMSQVIQENIETILIKVVVDGLLKSKDKELIIARIKSQLGEINVRIEEVSHIPLSANGKFKAVISTIQTPH